MNLEAIGKKQRGLFRGNECCEILVHTHLEKELKLIRLRLESIEEALAEEMTDDDKRALKDALKDHGSGKSVPFSARKH